MFSLKEKGYAVFKKLTNAIAIAALFCLSNIACAETTTIQYTPDNSFIFNPERGFYQAGTMVDSTNYGWIRNCDCSLCYASINLEPFRSSAISLNRLNEIERAFGRIREAGIKSIIRIVYNDDSSGLDASLEWMETHLQQLQPIFAEHADVIALFQAGMIGAWGEWHGSSHNHQDNPGPVWNLLVNYLPAEKFIAVRTPSFVNLLEGLDANPLTEQEAFSGSARARIAHHNDCWIASLTDVGTYPSDPCERELQKAQVANQSKYTPWGGETCCLSDYSNCTTAVPEAERFHATYLNKGYHPDVIAQLTSQGCWQNDFAKKLGYRLELIDAELPVTIVKGKEFNFTINLKNVGWAPLFNNRPVFLRIFAGDNIIADYQLTNNADPRRWLPEEGVISLSETLRAPAIIDASTVDIALWLPDMALQNRGNVDYSVRFANAGVWNTAKGHNILATQITIKEYQIGDFDNNDVVNINDLAIFADYWLDNCFSTNWCDYCDINESGEVDFLDFAGFASYWQ